MILIRICCDFNASPRVWDPCGTRQASSLQQKQSAGSLNDRAVSHPMSKRASGIRNTQMSGGSLAPFRLNLSNVGLGLEISQLLSFLSTLAAFEVRVILLIWNAN